MQTDTGRRCIGLDVHREFAQVAIWQGGLVTQAGRFATTPEGVRAFADGLGPADEVALEATGNTWAIATLLASRAGRVMVSNPVKTRAIAEAKVKTDKVDAEILAQLLAADYLPAVWRPDPATAALRRQVLRRAHLVRQRTRLKNQVHAILHRNLIPRCPAADLFGHKGRRWLAEQDLCLAPGLVETIKPTGSKIECQRHGSTPTSCGSGRSGWCATRAPSRERAARRRAGGWVSSWVSARRPCAAG
jgi:transposase